MQDLNFFKRKKYQYVSQKLWIQNGNDGKCHPDNGRNVKYQSYGEDCFLLMNKLQSNAYSCNIYYIEFIFEVAKIVSLIAFR